MSGRGGLYAGEIECLASRLLEEVRWLGVFARDELPNLTRESRPWRLILNTDPKALPGTHWLALYGPSGGRIELFDSFSLPPINYNLDSLDSLHLSFSLQSPSSSVCGDYCLVYIYLRSHSYSLSDIVYLFSKISDRDSYVQRYIHNIQNELRILNPCHCTGQCCKLQCQFC